MYRLLFRVSAFKNNRINAAYKLKYPNICLPPDEALFETYQLNYQKFIEDGKRASIELIEWVSPYLQNNSPCILDWGCGVGRIIRHLQALAPQAILYGCDINDTMIDWNKKNYKNIQFQTIGYLPPLPFPPSYFDVIFGMSILTHIEEKHQENWLASLYKVLKKNGILIISTQGKFYDKKLIGKEKKILRLNGVYTQMHRQKGHQLMATYQVAQHFVSMIAPYFTILEMYEGIKYPHKIGGQDLWILQKKLLEKN